MFLVMQLTFKNLTGLLNCYRLSCFIQMSFGRKTERKQGQVSVSEQTKSFLRKISRSFIAHRSNHLSISTHYNLRFKSAIRLCTKKTKYKKELSFFMFWKKTIIQKMAIWKGETRSQGMARMQDLASFTPECQGTFSIPL